jgi:hypothetical protein
MQLGSSSNVILDKLLSGQRPYIQKARQEFIIIFIEDSDEIE